MRQMLGILLLFACLEICHLLIIFKIDYLKKNSFRNTTSVSNSLDPDKARLSVGPDLGPICLQRLSADDTSQLAIMLFKHYSKI